MAEMLKPSQFTIYELRFTSQRVWTAPQEVMRAFPSPRPSPLGRGESFVEIVDHLLIHNSMQLWDNRELYESGELEGNIRA